MGDSIKIPLHGRPPLREPPSVHPHGFKGKSDAPKQCRCRCDYVSSLMTALTAIEIDKLESSSIYTAVDEEGATERLFRIWREAVEFISKAGA